VLLLVPSGCRFVLQVFGHLAHVRLPFACATMHSAVSWTRAGPGVRVSLLRPCSRSCASCSPSDRGSFVIGQVTVPAFLRVAAGFSDGLFAHAVCPSRCQLVWYLVGCRLVDGDPVSNLFSTNLAPCRRRDSQSHLKGANLRTPQPKILPPRRLMSAASEFATILTVSPSTLI
jgi:hypothetical protein